MQVRIDPHAATIPTDYSWQFGLGADHAWQFHRADVCRQLKKAREELGFRQVRFHGIFNDDMFTYQTVRTLAPVLPKDGPIAQVNFRQVADVLDNILDCGVQPFMELSFMPAELASGRKSGLKYKNNITPPKHYGRWAAYIAAFIRFLLKRYGKERVESWWFEVWNEPDLGVFFSGSQKEYFKLYETTARAIKAVDPKLKVGGPSTSACRWIGEFMTFCKDRNVPLDFISTHHYPGDGFGNLIMPDKYLGIGKVLLDAWRQKKPLDKTMTEMFFYPEAAAGVPKGALTQMDEELLASTRGLPTIISEWNSMAIFGVPLHDEKYSAAFALKTVLDLDNRFQGYMFWCLSDIYEEQLQLNRPFFGGFGLMTVDGIPKPNFWAFKMLAQLYPERLRTGLRTQKEVEYAAFRQGKQLQVLVYAQNNDCRVQDSFSVELELGCAVAEATVQKIDDTHCNPKAMWQGMGSPDYLSRDQVREICEATRLREEPISLAFPSSIRFTLKTNDIHLYTFTLA